MRRQAGCGEYDDFPLSPDALQWAECVNNRKLRRQAVELCRDWVGDIDDGDWCEVLYVGPLFIRVRLKREGRKLEGWLRRQYLKEWEVRTKSSKDELFWPMP